MTFDINNLTSEIDKDEYSILKYISEESGLTEFWLHGSLTYKKIVKDLGINFEVKDFDLVLNVKNQKPEKITKLLTNKGFEIIESCPFYVKFEKVHNLVASKGSMTLDIAFVKNLSILGHFNWESIFWHFPSGKIYDPYNGINDLKTGKLILIDSLDDENPLMLMSRFVKLSARFNLDFCEDKKLFQLVMGIKKRIQKWNSDHFFHGTFAKEYYRLSVLEAILRAKNREKFLLMLQKTKIIYSAFPEINEDFLKPNLLLKINKAKGIKDLDFMLKLKK